MRYYVMADLHGRFDLLKKAVDKIRETASGDYKIVTLGDYIDRGPESKQIVDMLIGMSQYPDTVCLKGNHEDMMVQVLETPSPRMKDWWEGNGGDATWKSYGGLNSIDTNHYKWMKNLPYYYESEKQLFVHAGVPQSEMNLPPKDKGKLEEMIWMLYDKTDGRGWKGKHVVHGHHQFADGPHVWHGRFGGRTDLDCWAYHTGRLVIGVFDDSQGPALEFIEVTS
jgi:serine/threonine protein phosphatase 1